MKKGWYRKAKIKRISRDVYGYRLTRKGLFGSEFFEVIKDPGEIKICYYISQSDWQTDMKNSGGFAERFIWAEELARKQPNDFYFTYKLSKNIIY